MSALNTKEFSLEVLESLGEMPLPPYIHEKLDDRERYQTVYAKESGSAAAPTAGLHFTKELLAEIQAKGVHLVYLTLHVGLGTFRPVSVDNLDEHEMHSEFYQLSEEAAATLRSVKENGVVSSLSEPLLSALWRPSVPSLMGKSKQILAGPISLSNLATTGRLWMPFQPTSTCQSQLWSCWFLPFAGRELVLDAYPMPSKEHYRFFSFRRCHVYLLIFTIAHIIKVYKA